MDFNQLGKTLQPLVRPDSIPRRTIEEIQTERNFKFDLKKDLIPDVPEEKFDLERAMCYVKARTPLSNKFFSQLNLDYIHESIRRYTYQKIGKKIDRQSEADVFSAMVTVFNEYQAEGIQELPWLRKQPVDTFVYLNMRTIRSLGELVVTNVRAYEGYLKGMVKPRRVLDQPRPDRPEQKIGKLPDLF